jgi:acetylornithine deacetylase/succinyl-diaminopimelate desuccinylase-like protein
MTILDHTTEAWDRDILPALHDFIRIPNVSPAYEARWDELGHMERATQLVAEWCRSRPIPGMTVDIHRLPGRTPLILVEIPPANGGPADDTVLLYGHLDKQPEMVGWRDDLGPWKPVVEGRRLYGRGGADDGYAAYAALAAIEAAQAEGLAHARCVLLVEASEESGSPDLPAYVEALLPRIGSPSLVICLDGGGADYDRLWLDTSLRGLAGGTLRVDILREGVHSGSASGIVPSSFRIARRLLSRLEDERTGAVLLPECHVDIPADRFEEARATAAETGPLSATFPFVDGAEPVAADAVEQMINHTWKPALSVVGADGLPPSAVAGNVLRPTTSLRLSMRLPPTCDSHNAHAAITEALTTDTPYGARVTYDHEHVADGWNAPAYEPWLREALDRASRATFGQPARYIGEGGSIPFMSMLGSLFPDAQFAITGVVGPGSNAHGPNEFLDIPTGKKITAAMAMVLGDHARR